MWSTILVSSNPRTRVCDLEETTNAGCRKCYAPRRYLLWLFRIWKQICHLFRKIDGFIQVCNTAELVQHQQIDERRTVAEKVSGNDATTKRMQCQLPLTKHGQVQIVEPKVEAQEYFPPTPKKKRKKEAYLKTERKISERVKMMMTIMMMMMMTQAAFNCYNRSTVDNIKCVLIS